MKGRPQRTYDTVPRSRPVHRVMKAPWSKYKMRIQRWKKAQPTESPRKSFTEEAALRTLKGTHFQKIEMGHLGRVVKAGGYWKQVAAWG